LVMAMIASFRYILSRKVYHLSRAGTIRAGASFRFGVFQASTEKAPFT